MRVFLAFLAVFLPLSASAATGDLVCTSSGSEIYITVPPPSVNVSLSGAVSEPAYVSGALILGYYDGRPVQVTQDVAAFQSFVIKAFFVPFLFFLFLIV